MTPCPTHLISLNLCGCAPKIEQKPGRPDRDRLFFDIAVGERVRFAGATRVIAACPVCGLHAVPVADLHLRRWPFRENGMAVERKALRTVYVHDAVVGMGGYQVGAQCVVYERPQKRKKK